jgi:UDP-N-acetylmuramoyl-tripeptide--D-alanyl-D-alanine ligase
MNFREWVTLLKESGKWNANLIELIFSNQLSGELTKRIRFCHDSRSIREGDIFIALKGERVDGHSFVNEAFRAGASLAVVSELNPYDGHCLYVEDTLKFIQECAVQWWKKRSLYTIGITGSNGKTTTKEWTKEIIGRFFSKESVFFNPGSQNTEIGLPLAVLNGLETRHRYAVIELGLTHRGDLRALTASFPLNCAVLLNVGTAHIGNFDNYDALFDAKCEIIDTLPPGSDVVLYWNDKRIRDIRYRYPNHRFSFFGERVEDTEYNHVSVIDYKIKTVDGSPETEVKIAIGGSVLFLSFNRFLHRGFVMDICASLAACSSILSHEQLCSFDSCFLTLPEGRFEIHPVLGNWIITDYYNASIESVGVAMDLLKEMKSIHYIDAFRLVLGSVLETGSYNDTIHKRIWEKVLESGPTKIYVYNKDRSLMQAFGDREGFIQKRRDVTLFESDNIGELASAIADDLSIVKNQAFYFKASRMVKLEDVVENVMDFLSRRNTYNPYLQIQHSSL